VTKKAKKLVLDEWLWADAGGDNGEERQRESLQFLEAVLDRCDRIVIPKGTEFARKFWNLCRGAGRDQRLRKIVRLFAQKFVNNSGKGEILELPTNSLEQAEPEGKVKPDDHYLVLTFRESHGDLLVTTDQPLIYALRNLDFPVIHRDDFMQQYLSGK